MPLNRRFYDDPENNDGGPPPGEETGEGAPPTDDGKESETGNPPQLINQEICPGKKPGDTITLKIVAVNPKEYTVEYMYEGDQEPEGGEMGMPPEGAAAEGGGGRYSEMM
jgi:hypothetical protein